MGSTLEQRNGWRDGEVLGHMERERGRERKRGRERECVFVQEDVSVWV